MDDLRSRCHDLSGQIEQFNSQFPPAHGESRRIEGKLTTVEYGWCQEHGHATEIVSFGSNTDLPLEWCNDMGNGLTS